MLLTLFYIEYIIYIVFNLLTYTDSQNIIHFMTVAAQNDIAQITK